MSEQATDLTLTEEDPQETGKELIVLSEYNALELFTANGMPRLLATIEERVKSIDADPSTTDGQDTIRSIHRKLGSTKAAIDEMRKDLVTDRKRELAEIDKVGREAKMFIEALQIDWRKPLTEIEERERARKQAHEDALAAMRGLAQWEGELPSEQIEARLQKVDELYNSREWQEYSVRVMSLKLEVAQDLQKKLEAQKQLENERVEQERLRKEEEERKQREREEQIRREAEEKARREAEEAIERERREKEAAMQRAKEAEERAERERIAAEERQKLEAEQAKQREQQRIADEQRKAEEERLAREAEEQRKQEEENRRLADEAHRQKVNGEILDAIRIAMAGGENHGDAAHRIMTAMLERKIPHVKIVY